MLRTTAKIGPFARFFASNASYRDIEVEPYRILLSANSLHSKSEELQATKCLLAKGFIWFSLQIEQLDGKYRTIGGLKKRDALNIKAYIDNHIKSTKQIISVLKKKMHEFKEISNWATNRLAGTQWVANRHLQCFNHNRLILTLPDMLYQASGYQAIYMTLKEIVNDLPRFQQKSNEQFEKLELRRYKNFFGTLLSQPTIEQQKATICDEDAVRVVASAGSGKTTLLLTKIQYLLEKKLAKPKDILVLAFNRSAKDTVKDKLLERTGLEFEVHTFHSFGLKVLAEGRGKKPTSDIKLGKHIEKLLEKVLENPECFEHAAHYFSEYLRPHRSSFGFKTQGEYFEYLKNQQPISLQGEELKSIEELTLANTLFLYGIKYQYECPYEIDTADKKYRQYKPDFFLPDQRIYIEHFALNEDGEAPKYFKDYVEGVKWKRKIHKEYGTILIETYSHQARNGTLQSALLKQLEAHGVSLKLIPQSEIFSVLNQQGYVSELAETLKTFLHLFKGKDESIESLRDRLDLGSFNGKRMDAFLKIFHPLFDLYQRDLKKSGSIDFDDMINLATKVIELGKNKRKFKYLLIDEFQDISLGRAKFLATIKNKLELEQLFAVGDDWQAINRFAGGDVSVMTSFENHYGFSSNFSLTQTFRFNDRVNDVASTFILKNPEQLPKIIKPFRKASTNQVIMIQQTKETDHVLESILSEIENEANNVIKPYVLILARYKYVYKQYEDEKTLTKNFPKLCLNFSTIHSAKGQEADFVILLGLMSGTYGKRGSGFPSEAIDDPLFTYLLASSDSFENAEERRLFYVALTRTKNKIYLVSDAKKPSKFAEELLRDEYHLEKRGFENHPNRKCPNCVSSYMVTRESKNGRFLSCSNYPYCAYSSNFCAECGEGFFRKHDGKYICDNPSCFYQAKTCPRCNNGFIVKRMGKFGEFWGCSNYQPAGCKYTEKI